MDNEAKPDSATEVVLVDKILVLRKDGKYESRPWSGYYSPLIASAISNDFGTSYEHVRFENGIPVVREISFSEMKKFLKVPENV